MLEELIEQMKLLESKVNTLLDLQIQANTLTTYNDVAKCLGLTTRTIRTYISNGTFTEGIHFYKSQRGKITFISEHIINFKNRPIKEVNTKDKSIEKVYHKSVKNITKGLIK